MKKSIIIIVLIAISSCSAFSQLQEKTQTFFSTRYTFHAPMADMADRFGLYSSLGVSFGTKRETGLYMAGNAQFIFGNDVKQEGLIQNLLGSNNIIIGNEGSPATVLLQQRGFYFSGDLGKFLAFKNSKNESGILLSFGAGFIQHQIRFESQLDEIPQLEGDYKKGYDRLSNGLMFSQNVGWLFFSKRRAGDFYVGLELIEGLTQSRRSYNFDTANSDLGINRLDLMFGIKAAWIVPFYKRNLYK